MLPPRVVYSLVIRNHSSNKVSVVVTYVGDSGTTSISRISVAANGSATAPQRTYTAGYAVFAMEISKVAVVDRSSGVALSSLSAPFPGVNSPVQEYTVEVFPKGRSLTLVAKTSD